MKQLSEITIQSDVLFEPGLLREYARRGKKCKLVVGDAEIEFILSSVEQSVDPLLHRVRAKGMRSDVPYDKEICLHCGAERGKVYR